MYIEIKNLSKIYNNYLAVNKINFAIEKNKTIGLLGPNGCGKTTTIGMMLGLVSPTSGEIKLENKDIAIYKRDEILKNLILPLHMLSYLKNLPSGKIWRYTEGYMELKT